MNQLENMTGNAIESEEILYFLYKRMPTVYVDRLVTKQQSAGVRDLTAFRKAMVEIIAHDEKVNQIAGHRVDYDSRRNTQQHSHRSFNCSALAKKSSSCLFCKQSSHKSIQCKLSPRDRTAKMLKDKRCTKCLRQGHWARNCEAEPCRICKGPHHTFLCYRRTEVEKKQYRGDERKEPEGTIAFSAINTSAIVNTKLDPFPARILELRTHLNQ